MQPSPAGADRRPPAPQTLGAGEVGLLVYDFGSQGASEHIRVLRTFGGAQERPGQHLVPLSGLPVLGRAGDVGGHGSPSVLTVPTGQLPLLPGLWVSWFLHLDGTLEASAGAWVWLLWSRKLPPAGGSWRQQGLCWKCPLGQMLRFSALGQTAGAGGLVLPAHLPAPSTRVLRKACQTGSLHLPVTSAGGPGTHTPSPNRTRAPVLWTWASDTTEGKS